jgi:hypothetical protein
MIVIFHHERATAPIVASDPPAIPLSSRVTMGGDLSKFYNTNECGDSNSISDAESEEMDSNRTFLSRGVAGCVSNTVIIFDWDDTLLCSSAINTQQWNMQLLRELERAAESALHTAMGLGEVYIITNGNGTWVEDSAKRFLPRLLPTLAQLKVVSARALHEESFPGDPFMWKRQCFNDLFTHSNRYIEEGINMVALGDQHPEIEAAQNVVKILGGASLVKTVKLKEAPSVLELLGQLGRIERELPKLVYEDMSVHRSLLKRDLPAQMEHMASRASGWRCTNKADASAFAKSLTIKELWPLFS